MFQSVHALEKLPQEIRRDARWQPHLARAQSGYGWWFWKPALANHLLRDGVFSDGDTLVYGDAGCTIGSASHEAWLRLLSLVEGPDGADVVACQLELLECSYTRAEIFARFRTRWDDKDYGLTAQICSTYFFLRVGAGTRALLAFWEALAADVDLISLQAPGEANCLNPRLIENRSDQSLFSMLLKANEPRYARGPRERFNVGHRLHAQATAWRACPAPPHPEFRVDGLRVLIIEDVGWPVRRGDATQPIAAARLHT
eukprot:NODE_14417_length_1110_cov_4.894201.p1 GENE.NODE_14417_length_1110_cov_4.894201~~NODE_14417_length_1110_cov_4.894201.p1  ORF type:complete len:257 (+),score=77.47 NODE_14417_length_1110_cov_4.894201:302-1072(+)